MRRLRCAALALAFLTAAAAPANAKNFRPGDLQLCNDRRCVPIVDQKLVNARSRFYYTGAQPAEVRKPRIGSPYFQLKFSNGYVSGIAATAQLDRFRSWCNCGHFGPDGWYRVPAKAALQLRKLVAGMQPLRVTESTIGRTRYG